MSAVASATSATVAHPEKQHRATALSRRRKTVRNRDAQQSNKRVATAGNDAQQSSFVAAVAPIRNRRNNPPIETRKVVARHFSRARLPSQSEPTAAPAALRGSFAAPARSTRKRNLFNWVIFYPGMIVGGLTTF